MKQSEILKTIYDSAEIYHNELENRSLLFVFGKMMDPEYFEACFFTRNFMHLTGIRYLKGSQRFFQDACDKRIIVKEMSFAENGTTEMKLSVLLQLVNIIKTARMVGDYNSMKSELYTEKMAGNITACLGFIKKGKYYVPNTALREDIRNVSYESPQRMLIIARKMYSDCKYSEISYLAKGVSLSSINFSSSLQELFSQELSPAFHKTSDTVPSQENSSLSLYHR